MWGVLGIVCVLWTTHSTELCQESSDELRAVLEWKAAKCLLVLFVFTSKFGTINLSKSRTMVTKGGVRTKVQTMVRQGGGGPAEGGHTGARPDLGPRQTTC